MKTKKLKVGTFMGQTQKMRTIHGFTLSKTYHSQLMKVPRHEHENPYISLLILGVYHEKSIISEYDVKSGSSLFRPKGFEHNNEIGAQNSFCFNIEIEKEQAYEKYYSKLSDCIQFERNNLEILKIFYGFLYDISDELLTIMVEENLYHLFQQQDTEKITGRALWVKKIKREVRLHPERIYQINEVANYLHLHPNYFVRKFKEKTGCTFGGFLLRQRLSKYIPNSYAESFAPIMDKILCGVRLYFSKKFFEALINFCGVTKSSQ